VLEAIKVIGGKVMEDFLLSLSENKEIMDNYYNPGGYSDNINRKLSIFSDREGKTRTIAIGDYLTQSVLKPFHG
jgi:hypothetical protein